MNISNEFQKRTIEKLKTRITTLEDQNATLITENENLKKQIMAYESTIDKVNNVQEEYFSGLDEIKQLKEKYRAAISEAQSIKADYLKEANNLIKNIRKNLT